MSAATSGTHASRISLRSCGLLAKPAFYFKARRFLRWRKMRGPKRHSWPFVGLLSLRYSALRSHALERFGGRVERALQRCFEPALASLAPYFSSWLCFMTTAPSELKTEIKLLDDGNIQLKFVAITGDADLFCTLTPQQAASLAAHLLTNVGASYYRTSPGFFSPPLGPFKVDALVHAHHWSFGHTDSQNQKAAVLHIGNATIGVPVNDDRLREFGRVFVNASWKVRTSATSRSLLSALLKEFGDDLGAWYELFASRARATARDRNARLTTWMRGGSLRIFKTVAIAPGVAAPKYPAVNRCIYCDAPVYSEIPGDRAFPFGGEHIIAEGLGGTVELPEASCRACETATGAVVEGDVLGRTMKALRIFLNLKKAGSGPHPKTLPLDAVIDGQNKRLELPVEDYPIFFLMLSYGPPSIDGPGGTPLTFGASAVNIRYDQIALVKKYRLTQWSTPYWDNHMLCRMLAKIGHSFATAELTLANFSPLLTGLIRKGDLSPMRYIGSDQRPAKPSTALHVLELGYQRIKGKTYVVARIRLFARYENSPSYLAIVGESSEHPIARAKRVFSSRISRMLVR